MNNKLSEKILVSRPEVAELLSLSPKTVWNMTIPRGPIPSVRMGGRVLYSVEWLQQYAREKTAETERQNQQTSV